MLFFVCSQNGGIRASWFHGHRASQMLALVLALAGFILALVVFDVSWRLSDPTPHRLYDLHRFLGLVVMAFVVVQVSAQGASTQVQPCDNGWSMLLLLQPCQSEHMRACHSVAADSLHLKCVLNPQHSRQGI